MNKIENIKTKKHKGVEKLTLQTKSKADSIIKLSDDIKKGKNVPAIKVHNTKSLVSDLKNKGLSKKEREDVLQEIMFNNEKRILKLKNQLLDRKLKKQNKKSAKKINKVPIKRNASSFVFKPIYSDAVVKKQENLYNTLVNSLASKKKQLAEHQKLHDIAKAEEHKCDKKWTCNTHKHKSSQADMSVAAYWNWWKSPTTGLARTKREYDDILAKKEAAYVKLNNMHHDNEVELKKQRDLYNTKLAKEEADRLAAKHKAELERLKWEEERARENEQREQEQHEAELRKTGIEENTLELKLAEQATLLKKLEGELKANSETSGNSFEASNTSLQVKDMPTYEKILGIALFAVVFIGMGYSVYKMKK